MEVGSFPTSAHPAHWLVVIVVLLMNVSVLLWLNHRKAKAGIITRHTWAAKRVAYWAYMILASALVCYLDLKFEVTEAVFCVRTYLLVFPLGLIDFYFAECRRVDLKVIAGSGLWCLTMYLRVCIVRQLVGPGKIAILSDFSTASLLKEALRYVVVLIFVGIFGDLIFSPAHRLAHHRRVYAYQHKVHHEYTNNLTALVLYHGSMFDDFLMPLTVAIGAVIFAILVHWSGLDGTLGTSNLTEMLMLFNTLFAHAHDVRCANLMFPLPAFLNFSAYHVVHHLNPDKNFGLTLPSDIIWDKLLGVKTAIDPAAFEAEMKEKRLGAAPTLLENRAKHREAEKY